jgi:hypothetical protein
VLRIRSCNLRHQNGKNEGGCIDAKAGYTCKYTHHRYRNRICTLFDIELIDSQRLVCDSTKLDTRREFEFCESNWTNGFWFGTSWIDYLFSNYMGVDVCSSSALYQMGEITHEMCNAIGGILAEETTAYSDVRTYGNNDRLVAHS